MLDIELMRKEPQEVKRRLSRRGIEPPIDQILELDAERRALLTEVERLKAERNRRSKEANKMLDQAEREDEIGVLRDLGARIASMDEKVHAVDEELEALMVEVPNLPEDSVPDGADESANVLVRTVGEPMDFNFEAKPHWELGPQLGIIDFDRGVKMTGSRFYILNGPGAQLQRALIAWMIDTHLKQGYEEKYLPFMVRERTLFAAGQLPKFRDNLYRDQEDDRWMIPTAEVPLTGLHMDEILEGNSLPRYYTAYTPCFRREKMSAGRDVRGIKRGHQFDKVEMYIYCRPEDSEAALEEMLGHAEEICLQLELPYRVIELCTGDLGFTARKTYDIEAWAAGCGEWLEVSSISNCGDFQARRANARYRPEAGARPRFLHTLNGSGLGLPRSLIAVLENNQREDGSVVIPQVLHPWMGGLEVIKAGGMNAD